MRSIAKGTLPLELLGACSYGERLGWLAMPSLAAQAAARRLFGLAIETSPAEALLGSTALSLAKLAALAALLALRAPRG
jgi:hypothetical protein